MPYFVAMEYSVSPSFTTYTSAWYRYCLGVRLFGLFRLRFSSRNVTQS
jgi:hypothetical protein